MKDQGLNNIVNELEAAVVNVDAKSKSVSDRLKTTRSPKPPEPPSLEGFYASLSGRDSDDVFLCENPGP